MSGSFRYERIDNAGHWMQLEAPEEVNRLLLDFLRHEAVASEKPLVSKVEFPRITLLGSS